MPTIRCTFPNGFKSIDGTDFPAGDYGVIYIPPKATFTGATTPHLIIDGKDVSPSILSAECRARLGMR